MYRISVAGACHARHTSGSDFFVRRHLSSQDELGPWIMEGSHSCSCGVLLVKISSRISWGKVVAGLRDGMTFEAAVNEREI